MKLSILFKLSALFLLSVWGCLSALPVLAHTELVSASPAPGAVASPTLVEIRLTFNEPLSPGSTFELLTDNFQSVPGLAPQIEGSMVSAKLAAPLAVGNYTVQWRAVGDDGHAVEGSYPFSVSAEAQSTAAPWTFSAVALLAIVGLSAIGYGFYWQKRRGA